MLTAGPTPRHSRRSSRRAGGMIIPGQRVPAAAWFCQAGLFGRRWCGRGRFKGSVSARAQNTHRWLPWAPLWLPSARSPPPPPRMLAAVVLLLWWWRGGGPARTEVSPRDGSAGLRRATETQRNSAHPACSQHPGRPAAGPAVLGSRSPDLGFPRGFLLQDRRASPVPAVLAGSGTEPWHGGLRAPLLHAPMCSCLRLHGLACSPVPPCMHSHVLACMCTLLHVLAHVCAFARSGTLLHVFAHTCMLLHALAHSCMSLLMRASSCTLQHTPARPCSRVHALAHSCRSLLTHACFCMLLHVLARSGTLSRGSQLPSQGHACVAAIRVRRWGPALIKLSYPLAAREVPWGLGGRGLSWLTGTRRVWGHPGFPPAAPCTRGRGFLAAPGCWGGPGWGAGRGDPPTTTTSPAPYTPRGPQQPPPAQPGH